VKHNVPAAGYQSYESYINIYIDINRVLTTGDSSAAGYQSYESYFNIYIFI